jgi:hypothetical protein
MELQILDLDSESKVKGDRPVRPRLGFSARKNCLVNRVHLSRNHSRPPVLDSPPAATASREANPPLARFNRWEEWVKTLHELRRICICLIKTKVLKWGGLSPACDQQKVK